MTPTLHISVLFGFQFICFLVLHTWSDGLEVPKQTSWGCIRQRGPCLRDKAHVFPRPDQLDSRDVTVTDGRPQNSSEWSETKVLLGLQFVT